MFELFGQYDRNDARCTCEIKCTIAMAKAAFSKATLVTSKLDLNLWKKLVQCSIWSISLSAAETWTLRKGDQKYLKFLIVVLQKGGEDQLDR